MRFLATLQGQARTERLVAYLASRDVSTHLEPNNQSPEAWDIWIRDEDQLVEAKSVLKEYEANPNDARYEDAVAKATIKLQEERDRNRRAAKRVKTRSEVFEKRLMSGRIPPLTLTLLLTAIAVSLLTNFGRVRDVNSLGYSIQKQLMFVNPDEYLRSDQQDPAASIKKFEIWRVITPIFIHLSEFHILFNGFMLVSLGRIIERLEGTLKFAILVLLMAVVSNMMQGLLPANMMGNPIFGGLSGVTYGLFGYLWIKTTLNPQIGIALAPGVVAIMIGWLVITISGLTGMNVANMAHLAGLATGAGLAYISSQRK